MADPVRIFSPEVEQLLAEAAANPNSMLLRAPRNPERRTPFDLTGGVSVKAAGLSPPERRVLNSYRAEAAEVLWRWVAHSLVNRQEGHGRIRALSPRRSAPGNLKPMDVRAKAERLQSGIQGGGSTTELLAGLAAVARGTGGTGANLESLALLSLRVLPTDSARICLAVAQETSGASGACRAVLTSVISRSRCRDASALALYNLGWLSRRSRQPERAVAAYEAALDLAPDWGVPMSALLFTLLELEDVGRARSIALRLDDLEIEADEEVNTQKEGLTAELRSMGRAPSAQFIKLAKDLCDHTGDRTRGFLNAFFP